jgi:preprotein translocase subunit SecA
MNTQREVIYNERNKVLMGDDVREEIVDMFDSAVANLVSDYVDPQLDWQDWNIDAFNLAIERYLLPGETTFLTEDRLNRWDIDDIKENLREAMDKYYNDKIALAKELGADWSEIERIILLRVVDMKWMDHIDAMDVLKRGIGLRAYGQQDPVIAYKKEGFDMFEDMIMRIREQTVQLPEKLHRAAVACVVSRGKP